METVTISQKEYKELLKAHFQLTEQNNEEAGYKAELIKLKKAVLEMNVNEYALKRYKLNTCLDITDYNCGLSNVKKLLEVFSYKELSDFIAKKHKELYEGEINA